MKNEKEFPSLGKTKPRPIKIKYNKENKFLTIEFNNNKKFDLCAEYLRVESPSAEVQGHSISQKNTVAGKKYISITQIDQIGNYAIKLTFNDGHDTGIYSWEYLYNLCINKDKIWKEYLFSIEKKNLSRELG